MIAYISGELIAKGENFVVLENHGIGYKVFTTPKIIETAIGTALNLHIYTHVREDALALFGFNSSDDLAFFELLITVSGVGPKLALNILSAENSALIKDAIAAQDVPLFTRMGGVGKKTAEKIIVELREKLGTLAVSEGPARHSEEVLLALENLGYSPREIKAVVGKLDNSLSAEEKLRQALKLLSQ